MSAHRDAEVADVVVVLSQSCEGKVEEYLESLRGAGFELTESDEENLTVNGTIDTAKLPALRSMACVNYVRISMTYIADYPPGDARDADGDEEDDDVDGTVWSPIAT